MVEATEEEDQKLVAVRGCGPFGRRKGAGGAGWPRTPTVFFIAPGPSGGGRQPASCSATITPLKIPCNRMGAVNRPVRS